MSRRKRCDAHHFIYPPPDGPVSVGVCKHCGAAREGYNASDSFITSSEWNSPRPHNAVLFTRYQQREEPFE